MHEEIKKIIVEMLLTTEKTQTVGNDMHSATLSATNSLSIGLISNWGLRGKGQRLTARAMTRN